MTEPGRPADDGPRPLTLRSRACLVPPPRGPLRLAPDELVAYGDLARAWGLRLDLGLLAAGGGHTMTSLTEAALESCGPDLPPIDVAVLAYDLPDVDLRAVAGCALSLRLPGGPTAFSVSGQGVGAGFTALRVLQALHHAGIARHGALLGCDSSSAVLRAEDRPPPVTTDAVVLVTTGQGGLTLDRVEEEATADPGDLLASRPAPGGDLIVGGALAARLGPGGPPGVRWRVAPADRPITGVWGVLAACPPRLAAAITVADYDEGAGRLHLAHLRRTAGHQEGPP